MMKNLVCRWVPHDLIEYQKAESVRICKKPLQLLNNGGHRLIFKIITGDKTYVPFLDVPTCQKSKYGSLKMTQPTIVIKRR